MCVPPPATTIWVAAITVGILARTVALGRWPGLNGDESWYGVNVQELLSDAGVGRQQHVIVSQGQIDAVLNARPEERRLIIEEAAGILKYRKRKEKAERRLTATEGNLTRLGDLLREVRRQLRPLERQADAARRHRRPVRHGDGDQRHDQRHIRVFRLPLSSLPQHSV